MNSKMFKLNQSPIEEIARLSIYLKGMADISGNEDLELAAKWLEDLSRHICAQGYIGCTGGETCTSDHK